VGVAECYGHGEGFPRKVGGLGGGHDYADRRVDIFGGCNAGHLGRWSTDERLLVDEFRIQQL